MPRPFLRPALRAASSMRVPVVDVRVVRMLVDQCGVPVRVPLTPGTFRPDFDKISAAITPKTRAIIVNGADKRGTADRILPGKRWRRVISNMMNQLQGTEPIEPVV